MAFDPKLIPLFDGTDAGQSVVEWVEKAELVCRLSGVKHIECVVPMRLSGGAYAVYQQLSEEKRVAMDVTHLGGRHYLTLIDCRPSQFAIWRPLSC